MKYFLDTNIISYYLKGMYPSICSHLMAIPSQWISIPAIVSAEIEYGACKSNDYKKTKEMYGRFLEPFTVAAFDETAALYYGKIRAYLEKKGQLIGANDMLIAAIVLSENGILVTNNVDEFARIPGLRIENWTK